MRRLLWPLLREIWLGSFWGLLTVGMIASIFLSSLGAAMATPPRMMPSSILSYLVFQQGLFMVSRARPRCLLGLPVDTAAMAGALVVAIMSVPVLTFALGCGALVGLLLARGVLTGQRLGLVGLDFAVGAGLSALMALTLIGARAARFGSQIVFGATGFVVTLVIILVDFRVSHAAAFGLLGLMALCGLVGLGLAWRGRAAGFRAAAMVRRTVPGGWAMLVPRHRGYAGHLLACAWLPLFSYLIFLLIFLTGMVRRHNAAAALVPIVMAWVLWVIYYVQLTRSARTLRSLPISRARQAAGLVAAALLIPLAAMAVGGLLTVAVTGEALPDMGHRIGHVLPVMAATGVMLPLALRMRHLWARLAMAGLFLVLFPAVMLMAVAPAWWGPGGLVFGVAALSLAGGVWGLVYRALPLARPWPTTPMN